MTVTYVNPPLTPPPAHTLYLPWTSGLYPRAAWDPVVLEKAQGGTQEVVLPVREVCAVITGGTWACTQPFTSPAVKIRGGLNRFGWRWGWLHRL